jgi:hypothetical protein
LKLVDLNCVLSGDQSFYQSGGQSQKDVLIYDYQGLRSPQRYVQE